MNEIKAVSDAASTMDSWVDLHSSSSIEGRLLEIGPGRYRRSPSPHRQSPNPKQRKRRSQPRISSDIDYSAKDSSLIIAQDLDCETNMPATPATSVKQKDPNQPCTIPTSGDFWKPDGSRGVVICHDIEDLSVGHGRPFDAPRDAIPAYSSVHPRAPEIRERL